jgi:mannose-6-phosphate isomerase
MMNPKLYPLTFSPALRDYIWGGRRLETLYHRVLPPGVTAESWEISGHPLAPTAVDNGYWAGQPLPAVLADLAEELVGTRAGWALERGRFPLLIKLLDANADLSVQVHPDDAYALTHEDGELGKTEIWYVLDADPGACLVLGLRPGITRELFLEALHANRIEETLNYLPIRPGQAIPIPTGTVHALLAGTLATEIQQNSDLTYRIYDWGRLGADGKPRPLHLEKALDVIKFGQVAPDVIVPVMLSDADGVARKELDRNRYFVVEEATFASRAVYRGRCDGSSLEIWGCLSGQVVLEAESGGVALDAIRYALLPAALGEFTVTARQPSTCLRVYLPPAS